MFKFWQKKKEPEVLQLTSQEFNALVQETLITSANKALRFNGETDSTNTNNYPTKISQITAIKLRYKAQEDEGCELMKRLINIIASTQVGNGLELEGEDGPEKVYLTEFLDHNNIGEGLSTQFSKEAVVQGQVLVQLGWNPKSNMVELKYLPWDVYNYTVYPIGFNNLTSPYNVEFNDTEFDIGVQGTVLKDDEIAFCSFNTQLEFSDGRPTVEGYPTLGSIIRPIDDLTRDLIEWRISNKLYSHPTPHFKCTSTNEANLIYKSIVERGWKVGNAMASSADFKLEVPLNYWETLYNSILTNLKIISGSTGVAIAWLGFPDIMSNRSTAESLGEPIELVSASDLTAWMNFYEQMFDNVILMRNKNINSSQKLKVGKIKPRIQSASDRKWKQLVEFYLPAANGGLVSTKTLLTKIPGLRIDIDDELEEIKEERVEKLEEIEEAKPEPAQAAPGSTNKDAVRIKPGKFDVDGEKTVKNSDI